GGGEVAAARMAWVAWRRQGSSSARGKGRRGARARCVGATESRRWPVALHGGGRHRSAPAAERNREAERWEMKSGLICNFQKVLGPYYKTKISPKLELK